MNKTVLITGATSGIGEACAKKFAANGFQVGITGRRNDRLQQLKNTLEQTYSIHCAAACFDVRNREAASAGINEIHKELGSVQVLVNNAGLALGRSYFDESDRNDWDVMIETNINGLLNTSLAVIPFMKEQGGGHIINIGSVAGKEVYEKGNIYCATKFAVDAITKSQRIDLMRHKIKVTGIHPGAVETEFSLVRFKGDKETAGSIYKGFTPLTAEDVAETVYFSATLPPHVCINELTVTCAQQANAWFFMKE